jgi:hypothetical protein
MAVVRASVLLPAASGEHRDVYLHAVAVNDSYIVE